MVSDFSTSPTSKKPLISNKSQAAEKKDGFEEMGLEGSAFEALERDFQEVLQVREYLSYD
jgi:hypothetical protein